MTNNIIAVANQKGGVAKTTTAINLGASLALAKRRVLLVDVDPQSNLTSGVGLKDRQAPGGTIYEALLDDQLDPHEIVLPTIVDHLSVIPADRNLTGAEIELVSRPHRELRLRRIVHALREEFDVILVDSPPSLGLLTLNALVAADSVLVPLNCEYFALEGIAELLSTIDRVKASFNPTLELEGVLLTMYDDRTNLGQQVSANIRQFRRPGRKTAIRATCASARRRATACRSSCTTRDRAARTPTSRSRMNSSAAASRPSPRAPPRRQRTSRAPAQISGGRDG
jgi:chromosome partitioning protein